MSYAVPSALHLDPGTPPRVQLRGITKHFGGVTANEDVDLNVMPGEIHALLGENGAGKSTLMNILTGIYQPDAGEIIIDGYAKSFASPLDAITAGIGMVHQHFKLVEAFTVAENIHLGWSETPRWISAAVLEARTAELARRINIKVRPNARVGDLSTGEQQRVEILRVLTRNARVLILDEPTAVLTPVEARELFKVLKEFVAHGNSVIYISHKLEEVLEISDRITVMRGGRKVETISAAGCDEKTLATLMVGREIVFDDMRRRHPGAAPVSKQPVLYLDDVSVFGSAGSVALEGVSLGLYGGEILGIAGVAGNGQKELAQIVTGMLAPSSGRVLVGGADFSTANARDFAEFGVGHIPEDRLHSGLAPALSITDNAVLREYATPPVSHGPVYNPRAAGLLARSIAEAASVVVPDFNMPVRNLSGGNQQRLVARREMRIASKILVAAYPSRGLDVGAISTMMQYLVELRDAGVGVLFLSEELEELFKMSDRIAAMFQGKVMGVVNVGEASLEEVGLMMGGQRKAPQAAGKMCD